MNTVRSLKCSGRSSGQFSGPFCLETPPFHVRCPQILRNCSRERSLEHCHSHAFWSLNYFQNSPTKKLPIPLPVLFYFELIKVTVTDGPVSVLPPLRIAQKLPVRNSWESISKKLPIPLPILYYCELIREVLANGLYIQHELSGFKKALRGVFCRST